MFSDTPFVEYLIIGAHTSVWLALVIVYVFGLSLTDVIHADASLILVSLPFIYLLGMLFDSIVQVPLEPFRTRIRNGVFGREYTLYRDEFIAALAPALYSAYDARVQRVRVIGAAIFNWPLIGAALLLNLGITNSDETRFILIASAALCFISIVAWRNLYHRAYRFRRNAFDAMARLERVRKGEESNAQAPGDETLAAVAPHGDASG